MTKPPLHLRGGFHTALENTDSLGLAENVWRSIQAADSRECRYCHAYEHMDFHKQRRRYNSLE
ncbi:MAG: NapC/NirT family cytochrome c [Candidatus Sedimenticola sp. (ex Thyasira tokunagai)]